MKQGQLRRPEAQEHEGEVSGNSTQSIHKRRALSLLCPSSAGSEITHKRLNGCIVTFAQKLGEAAARLVGSGAQALPRDDAGMPIARLCLFFNCLFAWLSASPAASNLIYVDHSHS
eukprot:6206856-Pleurochrysis_carterae.AAC.2